MDDNDWKRFEELVYQAGGVLHDGSALTQDQAAHAMSFHTLGLAILDLLARFNATPNQPEQRRIIVPHG